MAAFSDTTRPPAPLPYVHRPLPPVADPRTADELLAEIGAELDRKAPAAKPERTRSSGKVATAVAGWWHGIETDAERTREAVAGAFKSVSR